MIYRLTSRRRGKTFVIYFEADQLEDAKSRALDLVRDKIEQDPLGEWFDGRIRVFDTTGAPVFSIKDQEILT
jgi:hypothetical protein